MTNSLLLRYATAQEIEAARRTVDALCREIGSLGTTVIGPGQKHPSVLVADSYRLLIEWGDIAIPDAGRCPLCGQRKLESKSECWDCFKKLNPTAAEKRERAQIAWALDEYRKAQVA